MELFSIRRKKGFGRKNLKISSYFYIMFIFYINFTHRFISGSLLTSIYTYFLLCTEVAFWHPKKSPLMADFYDVVREILKSENEERNNGYTWDDAVQKPA